MEIFMYAMHGACEGVDGAGGVGAGGVRVVGSGGVFIGWMLESSPHLCFKG